MAYNLHPAMDAYTIEKRLADLSVRLRDAMPIDFSVNSMEALRERAARASYLIAGIGVSLMRIHACSTDKVRGTKAIQRWAKEVIRWSQALHRAWFALAMNEDAGLDVREAARGLTVAALLAARQPAQDAFPEAHSELSTDDVSVDCGVTPTEDDPRVWHAEQHTIKAWPFNGPASDWENAPGKGLQRKGATV